MEGHGGQEDERRHDHERRGGGQGAQGGRCPPGDGAAGPEEGGEGGRGRGGRQGQGEGGVRRRRRQQEGRGQERERRNRPRHHGAACGAQDRVLRPRQLLHRADDRRGLGAAHRQGAREDAHPQDGAALRVLHRVPRVRGGPRRRRDAGEHEAVHRRCRHGPRRLALRQGRQRRRAAPQEPRAGQEELVVLVGHRWKGNWIGRRGYCALTLAIRTMLEHEAV
mmetsp:Transcript_41332/g.127721  ORF Transcript_41332/g.127721 Transcript_41332/m.127721 type:complete len:222 (+) Transcript_41332:645-1310(+)